PTALVCDYLNLDPRWQDSFGPILEHVRFSDHITPPLETSLPTLEIRGTQGALVDATMRLVSAGDVKGQESPTTLSLPPMDDAVAAAPGNEDFHAFAQLRASAPLVDLLRRVNPTFGSIEKADGLVDMRLSEMNVTAGNAGNIQLSGKLTLPAMEMR